MFEIRSLFDELYGARTVGLAFHQKKPIKAYEIVGSALDPKAQVTKNILTVKELLAPLSREEVGLVRCLGLNYADHAVRHLYTHHLAHALTCAQAEANLAKPTYPVLFYKPVNSLIGPDVPVTIPKHVQPVEKHLPDYEVELTVVIGKPAKNVSEADALDYVLAYTAGNDVCIQFLLFPLSTFLHWHIYTDFVPVPPDGRLAVELL